MARTINFVRDRRIDLGKQEKQDQQLFKSVVLAMLGLGALIVIAVAISLFFKSRVTSLQRQQKTAQQEIAAQVELEESYTVFANKLKILTELFGKRKEKQEALVYFSKLFGPNVMISQLSYESKKEVLSFVLKSRSVFVLEEVMNILESDVVIGKYPRVAKESLSRSADGSYNMQLSLEFGDTFRPLDAADGELNALGEAGTGEDPDSTVQDETYEEEATEGAF
jgi:Tfp pilus assembly protein PilN